MADTSSYDVVIIGGGPGGYNGAIRAGQLGLKVACVEKRATLGGTCLNVGCMPSKALLHASELYAAASDEFATLGIEVEPKLNLAQMMKQKADSVGQLAKGIEFLFKKNKVDWIQGAGRIVGPGEVEVTGKEDKVTQLSAKNIIIATGSEASGLPGVKVDQKRIVDFHRCIGTVGGPGPPGGYRRRHYRPGTGLGVVPPGGKGHGDRTPGPDHPLHGR